MATSAAQRFAAAGASVREQVRQQLIATAKREHSKVMQANPTPSGFRRAVDGIEGRREEDAKAGSVIAYFYDRTPWIAMRAMEVLRQQSPVHSGAYRDAHQFYIAGSPVADLSGWTRGQEIAITNTVPYARVIELGKMRMRVSGTDRVYARAAAILNRRFGHIADINFTYRGVVGGAQVNPRAAGPTVRAGIVRGAKGRFAAGNRRRVSGGQHNASSNRFPTLLIEQKGAVLGRLRSIR